MFKRMRDFYKGEAEVWNNLGEKDRNRGRRQVMSIVVMLIIAFMIIYSVIMVFG